MPTHNPYGAVSGKTPMKARRTSVNVTAHTPVPQDEALESDIEDFKPPGWRAPMNNRADLGESAQTLDPPLRTSARGTGRLISRISGFLPLQTRFQPDRGRSDRGICQEWFLRQNLRCSRGECAGQLCGHSSAWAVGRCGGWADGLTCRRRASRCTDRSMDIS